MASLEETCVIPGCRNKADHRHDIVARGSNTPAGYFCEFHWKMLFAAEEAKKVEPLHRFER